MSPINDVTATAMCDGSYCFLGEHPHISARVVKIDQRQCAKRAGLCADARVRIAKILGRCVCCGGINGSAVSGSVADGDARFAPLIRKTQPYAKRIAHKAIWVEPKMLAEIEYRAKSAEGKVRHPRRHRRP
jgi:hypothetical protein